MAAKRPRPRATPALPSTERVHPRSEDLDLLPTLDVVRRLHREDLRAVRAAGRVSRRIATAAEIVAAALAGGGRLIYVGAGTSGRLGVLDAAECPPTFGTSPRQVVGVIAGGARALQGAVEGAEDDPGAGAAALARLGIGPRDVVCGISASGRTPFVLGALDWARRRRARTLLVCCSPQATRGVPAGLVIAADTGPELVAGSTRLKAGTATKLILNALSTAAMVRLGKVYRGRMVALRPTNQKLRARALRILRELTEVSEARAGRLLAEAGGDVRIAVAMHLTSRSAKEAAQALRQDRALRGLSPAARGPTRKAPRRR